MVIKEKRKTAKVSKAWNLDTLLVKVQNGAAAVETGW
jgi:hypothetical protein